MGTPAGPRPRFITGPEFARELEAAGVISDLFSIERIVIVIDAAKLVQVHVQRTGDERILAVASLLAPDEVPPGEDGPFITRPVPEHSGDLAYLKGLEDGTRTERERVGALLHATDDWDEIRALTAALAAGKDGE